MRRRRATALFIGGGILIALLAGAMPRMIEETRIASSGHATPVSRQQESPRPHPETTDTAAQALEMLPVKGRAAKTGYARDQFGDGWKRVSGCSTRDIILHRDLEEVVLSNDCVVMSGVLSDPYTGTRIVFSKEASSKVQIDHVVALSDAWQKGAGQLSRETRIQLANDPLELLAVDGSANQQKSDGDAATWLPKFKPFRCEYIARQIAVKRKYSLWVSQPEKEAMRTVLSTCPGYSLP